MVAHNADFDMSFIIENCNRMGIPNDFTYVDTVGMARFLLPALNKADFFPAIEQLGILPRKTFSMGHAHDKRFYIECRKIL